MAFAALNSTESPDNRDLIGREKTPRVESFVKLNKSNIALRVMIYRGHISDLQPLVIVNSVEFPMPPSVAFCEQMWAAGLQVIFIERPGFGSSPSLPRALLTDQLIANGAAATAEAALLRRLIQQLGLENIILLGIGSANPVSYRLAMLDQNVALSIYSNVVFNKDIFDVFRPKWLQQMLRQTVQSRASVHIASLGIKFRMRRKPVDFYRLLMHQSDGDVSYLDANKADFVRAGQLFQSIEIPALEYDLRMSLTPDTLLSDGCFEGMNAIALSGTETPDHWQTQLNSEAERLAIPVAYAPRGDFLAPYASSDYFTALIRNNIEIRSAGQT